MMIDVEVPFTHSGKVQASRYEIEGWIAIRGSYNPATDEHGIRYDACSLWCAQELLVKHASRAEA